MHGIHGWKIMMHMNSCSDDTDLKTASISLESTSSEAPQPPPLLSSVLGRRGSNNGEREEISAAAPINSSTIRQICLRCAAKNARNVRVNQGGEGTLVCRGLF